MQSGLAVAAMLATSLAAQAADIPVKGPVYKAVPAGPPAYNWAGFYIGGHLGGAWGSQDYTADAQGAWLTSPAFVSFINATGSPDFSPSSFTGGPQIGYNWQFAPSWLAGIEADAHFMSLKSDNNTGFIADPSLAANSRFIESAKTDWIATLRARIGWVSNNWLLYGTGGFAWGHVKSSWNFFRTSSGYDAFGSADTTKSGWTVGGGLEYAFAPNWTLKGEYLYIDLGDVNYRTFDRSGLFPTFFENISMHTTVNIASVGLNYKFGP